MRLPAIALLVALGGLGGPFPARGPSAHVPPLVTLDGVGGVRPGMTIAQVEQRWRVDLRPGDFRRRCADAFFRSEPVEGYAIFWRGKLGSLWFDRGVRTRGGIHIGSTLAEVRRAYPRFIVRKDYYDSRAKNVFVRRVRAPHWRLRFDISPEDRVTRIVFGNWTVFLVEGCA